MEKILLRDNDLVKNTLLGGNIDVDRFKFCVIDAQRSALEEILGEELYKKISDGFDNYQDPYERLYNDYINPFLIQQSAVEYLKIGAYKVDNTGISKPAPMNATPIDADEIKYVVANQRHKANMYRERLEDFLRKNSANYPEYRYSSNNIVNPMNENQGGGWFFG